jgi:hypothetical protein
VQKGHDKVYAWREEGLHDHRNQDVSQTSLANTPLDCAGVWSIASYKFLAILCNLCSTSVPFWKLCVTEDEERCICSLAKMFTTPSPLPLDLANTSEKDTSCHCYYGNCHWAWNRVSWFECTSLNPISEIFCNIDLNISTRIYIYWEWKIWEAFPFPNSVPYRLHTRCTNRAHFLLFYFPEITETFNGVGEKNHTPQIILNYDLWYKTTFGRPRSGWTGKIACDMNETVHWT